MYNRYIPQNDGTYRRKSIQEPQKDPPKPMPVSAPPCPVPEISAPPPPCQNCIHHPQPRRNSPSRKKQEQGIGSFLKQLLPNDFGTEDLLVVILLLLMAGDCPEEQNSALLTLALYLFL